jgi:hypothetical protein
MRGELQLLRGGQFTFVQLTNIQSNQFLSMHVGTSLGKCTHRMPSGVLDRHTCIELQYTCLGEISFEDLNFSIALHMCDLNTT